MKMNEEPFSKISRRDFLKMGSVGACSVFLPGLSRAVVAETSLGERLASAYDTLASGMLSLGYSPVGEGKPETGWETNVIPAQSLSKGDPGFATYGARIDLDGMFPLEESRFLQACESMSICLDLQSVHGVSLSLFDYREGTGDYNGSLG